MAAVQVEVAAGELADLAEAAAQAELFHRRPAQVLEHRAGEVAHLDQGDLRQCIAPAHGVLAGVAGTGGDVTDAVGASDIDALMDRGDIGRAGERPDDAAGAEDRQPAEDAQARVHGLQRQLGAALHADGDLEAAGVAPFGGELGEVAFDHLSRHRIDRRLADRQGQPRAGHRTDPGAGMEAHARLGAQAHPGEHQGAMGDVGIVAGILEGAGFRAVFPGAAEFQAHQHLLALGQDDLHRVADRAAQQQARRRQAGGGGATAGGVAAAQRRGLLGGFLTHRGEASWRRACAIPAG
ncbi:Uncharacterised protein [Pseudomonas aeruginosa]|nr:Uncharacterised protein [Pseudomonas aeruginosa]